MLRKRYKKAKEDSIRVIQAYIYQKNSTFFKGKQRRKRCGLYFRKSLTLSKRQKLGLFKSQLWAHYFNIIKMLIANDILIKTLIIR